MSAANGPVQHPDPLDLGLGIEPVFPRRTLRLDGTIPPLPSPDDVRRQPSAFGDSLNGK
jgi:hypothetical protein